MKRNIFLTILIAFCTMDGFISYVTSQSNHWPSDGDKLEKAHYEYVDIAADPLLWDFSSVIATGVSHTMAWSNIGDSILVKRELGAHPHTMLLATASYGMPMRVRCLNLEA